jgi:hypothetical protein
MLLYKYLPFERKSILETGLIRFTQPNCFNDPFEALPNVEQFFSTEFVSGLFRGLAKNDLFEKIIEGQNNKETIEILKSLRSSFITLNSIEQKKFYNRLTIGDSTENPTTSMKTYWNEQVGILSLSEDYDNLTMWSHYTKDHEGFVLGFNPKKNITEIEKCMIRLKKVTYSLTRPTLTLFELGKDKETRNKQWINDFLFTKSKDWEYEYEWRQVNYLKRADEIKKSENTIYLFKYNIDSVEEVCLGCNMKPENKNEIVLLLKDWNIAIFEMKLNSTKYNLDKIRIN